MRRTDEGIEKSFEVRFQLRTLVVDLTGVWFFGLRLTSALPGGGGLGYQVSCGVAAEVQFLPD